MARCLLLVAIALGLAPGCKNADGNAEVQLLAEARKALAERDLRLTSYHVVIDSQEGPATARHEFFYRAPSKVKGVVTGPSPFTLSFDGSHFFRLSVPDKKLVAYELKLPVDKTALFLTSNFSPFVPEGFRTPLLPMKGVTARRVAHPRAPDAVELSFSTPDEAGRDVTVAWTLRLPSGDFLGKRTSTSSGTGELLVDDEVCDAKLGLCVPRAVTEKENGQVVHSLRVASVELNAELSGEAFTLAAPEGFTTETQELVEEGK